VPSLLARLEANEFLEVLGDMVGDTLGVARICTSRFSLSCNAPFESFNLKRPWKPFIARYSAVHCRGSMVCCGNPGPRYGTFAER
jgi:hypothetical protein